MCTGTIHQSMFNEGHVSVRMYTSTYQYAGMAINIITRVPGERDDWG